MLKNEQNLRKKLSVAMKIRNRTRVRYGKNPDVERAIEKWFRLMLNYGLKVNGPMPFERSKELAVKLGHLDFHPTHDWLSRWKKRN